MRNYLLFAAFAVFCLFVTTFYAQQRLPKAHDVNTMVKSASLQEEDDKFGANELGRKWAATMIAKRFIENKGQFDDRCAGTDSTVLFGIDDGGTQTFFKPNGVTYFLVERMKNPDRKKGDPTKPKKIPNGDYVSFVWGGANINVTVSAKDLAPDYSTYCMLKGDNKINPTINHVKGYGNITYNELYPGIDVDYVFHPEGGIKYALIVQPKAGIDKVKMVYPKDRKMFLDADGNLVIPTIHGDIIEHAPVTYYAGAPNERIPSKFKLVNNVVSFELGSYDDSRGIVIDPWVQSPTLASSNCIWECERDAAGNVYVIGGDAPMKLLKYSPTGVLQWTYNTPWDATPSAPGESDGDWLGGLATDNNGISYITRGSRAAIQKISTAGALIWSAAPTNILTSDEYWTIAFNCDQTRLVVGGTTGNFPNLRGVIFNINTNNGSVTGQRIVGTTRPSILPGVFNDAMEVRSISSSRNGRYYFLTLDSIGSINQNFTPCSNEPLFNDSHGYKFGYKSEQYRPSTGNGPNCAIRANDKFVYTHGGNIVHKRDLATGAIVGSAAIPGGINTVTAGFSQSGNNGIDIDTCGNVYVGSADRVIKFDANLNILTSVPLPFRVFDVVVSNGGEIIVCGGTGTSSSTTRTGFVQVVNMNACPQFTLVCCDATVCPAGPLCDNGQPITLVAGSPGGVWSGTGITNASTGEFSPIAAGIGVHKVIYTLPCGKDSTLITVNACANLEVCIETNGDYRVDNGTGPYLWESGVAFQNCSGCPFGNCVPFICPGFADTTWTTISTNATATPPGTFPIRLTDASGNRLMLYSAAGLLPCTTCPNYTTTVTSQTNIDCVNTTGSATVSSSGGTSPYTYNWSPGNLNGATQSGLAAGTYTVIATDAASCRDTISLTITSSATPPSVTATATPTTCGLNNGTATATGTGVPPLTYQWLPIGTIAQTVTNLAPGDYVVIITDGSGCSAAGGDTVTVTASPNDLTLLVTNSINPTCAGNDGSIDVSVSGGVAPYTVTLTSSIAPIVLNWATPTSQTVTGLPGGTVTIIVEDAQGCQRSIPLSLTAPTNCCPFTVSAVLTQPTCGQNNGEIVITPTNGSGNYTYVWANGAGTGNTASNLGANTYNVTITDNGFANCFIDTSFTLNSNSTLSLNLTNPVDPTCAGNDGSITVDLSGGTAPYTVTIDTGGTPIVVNLPVAISQTIGNLPDGTVNVTVVDDQGCQVNNTATLTAPTNCCTFVISAAITQPTCGQSNGEIVITPTNGSGNYTYVWANGAGTGNSASNLGANTYSVTITDNGFVNCFIDTSFTLINPNAPIITLQNQTNVACAGDSSGTLTISVNGGAAPYSILWSNGDSTLSANDLTVGGYTVTVTDANNCDVIGNYTITGASAVVLQMTATAIDCNDPNSGTASVVATGGTSPYQILWSNAATTATLNSVSAGWYTVTVTDAAGCIGIDSVEVTGDNVSAFNLGPNLNICVGDTVILGTGLAGTVWSTGDTSDYLIVTDGGTYYGTITSGNCSNSDTVTVFVEQLPNTPQLNVNDTIVCENESLILRVENGGQLYVWSTGDTTDQIIVDTPGIYVVTAINNCGEVSAEALVSDENCACRLYLPNAFSPNGDGNNDVLKVYTQCSDIEEFSFSIFDRWGGLVYRSNNFLETWNGMSKGKNCIPGVYVYSISYLSRENGVRQIQRIKGSITLLR